MRNLREKVRSELQIQYPLIMELKAGYGGVGQCGKMEEADECGVYGLRQFQCCHCRRHIFQKRIHGAEFDALNESTMSIDE
eukprot:CAMPEP_0113631796 /NCGR_PEP_ID=MMETSP0017_2-20120614/16522_1 /TAXON_ID=2856 /ORGANISM="Cylindrotheca closterium" /LENGTH=80 /DNA_ID=CAMNT_0000542317 /DNA_START=1 /DNA_END=243 /DNA_ORIENTATION=+ /assembly_acc=CAM_ASM_000147